MQDIAIVVLLLGFLVSMSTIMFLNRKLDTSENLLKRSIKVNEDFQDRLNAAIEERENIFNALIEARAAMDNPPIAEGQWWRGGGSSIAETARRIDRISDSGDDPTEYANYDHVAYRNWYEKKVPVLAITEPKPTRRTDRVLKLPKSKT